MLIIIKTFYDVSFMPKKIFAASFNLCIYFMYYFIFCIKKKKIIIIKTDI